jgi:transposase-like protein
LVLRNEEIEVFMKVIRYSKGFKLQLVREIEQGNLCAAAVHRKYNIRSTGTVMRWVRQFGSGKYGKVVRVESGGEVDEKGRLRLELRRVKEALADAHVDLALERAFLEVACEALNEPVEGFKKKHAGGRRTKPSRPSLNSK